MMLANELVSKSLKTRSLAHFSSLLKKYQLVHDEALSGVAGDAPQPLHDGCLTELTSQTVSSCFQVLIYLQEHLSAQDTLALSVRVAVKGFRKHY